jgi:hypothetical protein
MEIEGFENYLIYEDGRVYSKKRKKFLKNNPDKNNGYLRVGLWKDGNKNHFSIHRLIALHYIENPNNYPEVDHIDRDTQNNSLDNLRWCDRSMNQQNKGLMVTNKTGIKYISQHKGGYRFQKMINGNKHQKWFKTLEEALKYKEEYLQRNNNRIAAN